MGYNKELPKSLTSSGSELDPECGMSTSEIADDAKRIFRKHNQANLDQHVAEPETTEPEQEADAEKEESAKWNESNGSSEDADILQRLERVTQGVANVGPQTAFSTHNSPVETERTASQKFRVNERGFRVHVPEHVENSPLGNISARQLSESAMDRNAEAVSKVVDWRKTKIQGR